MFQDKAILIIEDNILLALDLSNVVEDFGGHAVGPATTAEDALRLLETEEIAAAVLDCQIADDDVTQIVMCLAARGIPVVITTITAPPPVIAAILPDAPIFRAPIQPKLALAHLNDEIAKKKAEGHSADRPVL